MTRPNVAHDSTAPVDAQAHLDFLFDASGWKCFQQSQWHICAGGEIGGRETLAIALGSPDLAMPASALDDLTRFVSQQQCITLVLVLAPFDVLDEADQSIALNNLLAKLARHRRCGAVVAAAMGPLVGPAAILARASDIVCLGPYGSLALADAATTKRIPKSEPAPSAPGALDCSFSTDASALLGVRRVANLLPTVAYAPKPQAVRDLVEDAAFERLAGVDLDGHADERRLIHLIADDRTFVEFDGLPNLKAGLARLAGGTVGVLASGPGLSGALDAAALSRAEKLVRFCNRQGLPVLNLVDCPGVIPDEAALDNLGTLLLAWAEIDVPVVSLVVRKAVGAAAVALATSSSRHVVLHWPGARIGLTRAGAVDRENGVVATRRTRAALAEILTSFAGAKG